MPLPNTQQRQQMFADRALGETARDIQQSIDTIPRMITRIVRSTYKEPFVLGSALENQQPESIELTRIINLNAPEQPVLCGSMVHYNWKPQNGGAVVTSIDGLAPSNTVEYEFTFRFSYTAKAGLG